jgi:hypothetical protein
MKVLYKKKRIAKVICPKGLEFPPNCIWNALIEFENGERVITSHKELSPVKHDPITNFL